VRDLIAAPAAKGLFAQAIVQSDPNLGLRSLAEAEAQGLRVVAAARVKSLADLRAMPLPELMAAAGNPSIGPPGVRYTPIRDLTLLPDPQQVVSTVPAMTGLTADEASAGSDDWNITSVPGLQSLLERRFGYHADRFAKLYLAQDNEQAGKAARAVLRDQGIATVLAWSAVRPRNAPRMFGYLFDWAEPGADGGRFGAFHTAEVPYAFETLDASQRPFTPLDRRLSKVMSAYWTNFVKTGNPNGAGLPRWPELATGNLMILGNPPEARAALSLAKRQAFEEFTAAGGALSIF
jgi:para-nitrobenzyl esterase